MKMIVTVDSKISFNNKVEGVTIGENGIGKKSSEGDRITPVGKYALRSVLYRADRVACPKTKLPSKKIQPVDGWCDDPKDPNYNSLIKLPFANSFEPLWREDHLYDFIIPIGYNDNPVVIGAGSAIFLHLKDPKSRPTKGCIGVEIRTMVEIIEKCSSHSEIEIIASVSLD